MGILFAVFLVAFQLFIALVDSTGLIYVSLLTGAMPLTLDTDKDLLITGPLGRLDVNAMRLLGLWLGASIVVVFHFARAWKYCLSYGFHALFVVFCCVALLWAPSLVYGIRMIFKLSAPFLFLLLILVTVQSKRQLKIMEQIILLSGFAVFATAIVLRLIGINVSPGQDHRLTIPATNASGFSAHLVAVGILALAGMKYGHRTKNGLLLLCLTTGTLLAITRITTAALFVGSSVVLYMALRGISRYILPLSGVIALPALFLLNETFRSRMFLGGGSMSAGQILQDPSHALSNVRGSGRFAAWGGVFDHFFIPNPFGGSGIGATQHYYYTHSVTGLGVIHSEYLRLLAELGIIGAILFALAVFAYVWRLVRTYSKSPQSDAGKYALAATGGLVAYVVFMATDNAFDYVNMMGIYVFGFIAMSEKAREIEEREASMAKDGMGEPPTDKCLGPVAIGVAHHEHRRYPII